MRNGDIPHFMSTHCAAAFLVERESGRAQAGMLGALPNARRRTVVGAECMFESTRLRQQSVARLHTWPSCQAAAPEILPSRFAMGLASCATADSPSANAPHVQPARHAMR